MDEGGQETTLHPNQREYWLSGIKGGRHQPLAATPPSQLEATCLEAGKQTIIGRMSTLTMSADTQRVSRYRALRGNSVSESRKAIDDALSDIKEDQLKEDQPKETLKESGSLLRRSAFGSRVLRRRSKTMSQIDVSADIQDITPHFPLPPVPQVAFPPKNTSRPNAAVKPVSTIYEGTTPLEGLGKADQPEPTRAPPPPPFTFPVATAVTTDTAVDGSCDVEWEWHSLEEQQKLRMDEEEAVRLADRLEAETDRILAEQKKLDLARLHQQLLANHAAVVTTPLKPKSPVLEKLNFFHRGRSSKAVTLSPPSSTTTSVDFSRAQSLDPMLSPRAFFETGGPCLLMTPPLSPMSSNQHSERVSIFIHHELVEITR